MGSPQFYRKAISLPSNGAGRSRLPQSSDRAPSPSKHQSTPSREQPCSALQPSNVLVINDSNTMATAITRQLLLSLPEANIMYAPTIELAGWMLRTRPIHLIISSEILPDGGANKLHSVIKKLKNPPDLLMVGDSIRGSIRELRKAGYRLVSRKRIAPAPIAAPAQRRRENRSNLVHSKLAGLGQDLRNDLNNPLQEIVTMAFVARQSQEQRELSNEALQAIERAAKQLAGTVDGLEERIRKVVVG